MNSHAATRSSYVNPRAASQRPKPRRVSRAGLAALPAGCLLRGALAGAALAAATTLIAVTPASAAIRLRTGASGTGGAGTGQPTKINLASIETAFGDDDELELQSELGGIAGRKFDFSGSATDTIATVGETVELQAKAPTHAASWHTVASVTVTSGYTFSGDWKPAKNGQFALRIELFPSSSGGTSTTGDGGVSGVGTPPVYTGKITVDVFKTAIATLYGPGFWGDQTACGEKLKRTTVGVANRTLKCGTKVAIDYRGHLLIAPVIDRGPYANHASWDLTMATAKKLGIDTTAKIATIAPAPAST